MRLSIAALAALFATVAVQAISVPRATAAPQPQLVKRTCLNPSCSKIVTVTTTTTTTTTLAPASTDYVTTTSTSTSTHLSSTTIAAPCVTGVIGVWNDASQQVVAYLPGSAPFMNTNGATYANGITVRTPFVSYNQPGGLDTHHLVETIGQAHPYFGVTCSSSAGTPGASLALVEDSSSAGPYPAQDISGTYYESNMWMYDEPLGADGNFHKAIWNYWTAPNDDFVYGLSWNSATGELKITNSSPAGWIPVSLVLV